MNISSEKKWTWVGLILLLRLPVLLYFIWQGNTLFPERMVEGFVLKEVDYGYFLQPVDRYFEMGEYSYQAGIPYAGRMPGYATPYYLLRLVFEQGMALQALILIQILLSAVSVYCLGRIAERVTRQRKAFLLTILFYGTSLYYLRYDFSSITEGPSVALFIIGLWHLFRRWGAWLSKDLLIAGLCITWMIFLRPFLGYLLLPLGLMLLWNGIQGGRGLAKLRPAVLFCIPFLLAEGLWIARNYQLFDRFIPLETPASESYGKAYSEGWLATRDLAAAFDVERAYFEHGLAWWFRVADDEQAAKYVMPEDWFEGLSFGRTELEGLRIDYRKYRSSNDPQEFESLDEYIQTRARAMESEVAASRPFQFHVLNRLENIQRRILTSGSSYVLLPSFSEMSLLQKGLKLFASFQYYIAWLLGMIGLLFIKSWKKSEAGRALRRLALIHIIAMPIILSFVPVPLENRYLFTLHPLLVVGMASFFTAKRAKV